MQVSSNDQDDVKIVVIDHSPLSRKETIKILEDAKFEVVGQAGSAEDALQYLSSSNVNLFLVDLLMPEVSGIDLIKMMSEKMINIHIIMMSSIHSNHLIIDSFSNGAFDFLNKPIDPKDLIKSVQKVQQLIQNESS